MITTSSTEAELLTLTHAMKEIYWWQRLFRTIDFKTGHESNVDCDNQQMIGLLTKDTVKLVTKLRHVNIHRHWLRQEVQAGRLKVNWVPTMQMPADGLTKALSHQKHENFLRLLGLMNI